MKTSPNVLIALNEINFDVIRYYLKNNTYLPNFREILEGYESFETYGEKRYEQLEPWIQWVSAQTGKTFEEHRVFRLGDISTRGELLQIFEAVEEKGLRVGAISPMNASNRLKQPAYFIPDPWTDTPSDSSGFSRRFTEMLRQTVNDNAAGRVSIASAFTLLESIVRSFSFKRSKVLLSLAMRAIHRPWNRALLLDQVIHLVHMRLLSTRKPDVSFVFFNAGAHVQHHYFFNAKIDEELPRNPVWYINSHEDPILEMLKIYDGILADYIAIGREGGRVLIATGLTQVPYDRVKYYYRLRNHVNFLRKIGLDFERVSPRMTRDFEIFFASPEKAREGAKVLGHIKMMKDDGPIFGEIEIRENSVFASLTYPAEISLEDQISDGDKVFPQFGEDVAFVAIKNGMHHTKGFAFLSANSPIEVPKAPAHVSQLYGVMMDCATA